MCPDNALSCILSGILPLKRRFYGFEIGQHKGHCIKTCHPQSKWKHWAIFEVEHTLRCSLLDHKIICNGNDITQVLLLHLDLCKHFPGTFKRHCLDNEGLRWKLGLHTYGFWHSQRSALHPSASLYTHPSGKVSLSVSLNPSQPPSTMHLFFLNCRNSYVQATKKARMITIFSAGWQKLERRSLKRCK